MWIYLFLIILFCNHLTSSIFPLSLLSVPSSNFRNLTLGYNSLCLGITGLNGSGNAAVSSRILRSGKWSENRYAALIWGNWLSLQFLQQQSPAGCREQVRDQPGHLSQGAFCIHWHRRAGLPHHRGRQHSQGWCTNSPWCESRDYVSFFISLFTSPSPKTTSRSSHSHPGTKFILPPSYLSVFYVVWSFLYTRSKSIFSSVYFQQTPVNTSPLTVSLQIYVSVY